MPPRAITQVCPQCEMPLVLPASLAGQTIACSRCGHAVLVSDPAAGVPAIASPGLPPHLAGRGSSPPDVRPPHLKAQADAAPAAGVALQVEPTLRSEPAEAPRKRSCLVNGCVMLLVSVFSLAAVVGISLLAVYFKQSPWTTGEDDANPTGGQKINKLEYTDASRKSLTIGGVTVRIDQVQLGKVDFRSKGEILQTATPHYLIVNVNVKNKSRSEPVQYQSWYDHRFEDEQGHGQDVELLDDNGRSWEVFVVPDADKVERHVKPEMSLSTDDEVIDSLVFKLPEEYLDEPIPPLYLQLPAAAVGNDGVYRFHVPGVMVQRRDR